MSSVPSGRFVVRLPPALHRALREEAFERGLSLNSLVIERLAGRPSGELREETPFDVQPIVRELGNRLAGIVLFGSAVRGEQTSESDIDLLIVLNPSNPLTPALYRDWDERVAPEIEAGVAPQFVLLPPGPGDAGSVWLEAAVEGRVLHDPSGTTGNFLRALRESIAEGKFRRRWSHGHPYWVRRESHARQVRVSHA